MIIIAGPCQHESLEQSMEIAKHCKDVCDKYGVEYIFKASYDKANRTSAGGKRGLGLWPTAHSFIDMKHEIFQFIEKDLVPSMLKRTLPEWEQE